MMDESPPRPICRPIARAKDPREHLKRWILDEAFWWTWMLGRDLNYPMGVNPEWEKQYRVACRARLEELAMMWRALVNKGGKLPVVLRV